MDQWVQVVIITRVQLLGLTRWEEELTPVSYPLPITMHTMSPTYTFEIFKAMICCKFFENFIQSLLIMFCPPTSPSSYQIHPHSSSTSKLCVFFEISIFKWPTKSNLLFSYISGEGHPQKCDWPTIGSRTFKANIMSLSHIPLTVDSYSFKSGIPWARNLNDLILYTSWPGNHSCYGLSCPEDTDSPCFSTISDSYDLSPFFHAGPWVFGECDIDVPFVTEHSTNVSPLHFNQS